MTAVGSAAAVVTADGVWWRYGRSGGWVLRGVSLTASAGDVVLVRGANGSGKSTLLRLLAGLVVPDRGRVAADGPVGYLPQSVDDLPPVPVHRLLRLLGAPPPADPVLTEHLDLRADELSAGTRRRLVLHAVLEQQPRLLVLDEPSAGLDPDAREHLWRALRERADAGCAVVVADHRHPATDVRVHDVGAAPDRRHVLVQLTGRGELLGRRAVDGLLQLSVPADDVDELLAQALREGWSVRAVLPP